MSLVKRLKTEHQSINNDNSNQINNSFNERLKELPIEIWMIILNRIDLYDLIRLKLVCKHFNYLVNQIQFKELILSNDILDQKKRINRQINPPYFARLFRNRSLDTDVDHDYNYNYEYTYLYTNKPMNLQFNITNYRSNCFENQIFKLNFQNLKYLRADVDYNYFNFSILNEFKLLEQLELFSDVWLNDDELLNLEFLKTIKIRLYTNDNCKLIINSRNLLAIECLYLKSIKILNPITCKQLDALLEDNYNLEEYLNLNNLIIKNSRDLHNCDKFKLPVLLKKILIEDKDDNYEMINTLDYNRTLNNKLKQLLTKYKNVTCYVMGVKIDLNIDFQRPTLISELRFLNNDYQLICNLYKNEKLNDKLTQFKSINCNLDKLFDSFNDDIPKNFYSTFFNIQQIIISHKVDQLKFTKFLDNYSNLKSLSLAKLYFDQLFFDELPSRCPNLLNFNLLSTEALIESIFFEQYDFHRTRNRFRDNNFDHLDNVLPIFIRGQNRNQQRDNDQLQQNNRNQQRDNDQLQQNNRNQILQEQEQELRQRRDQLQQRRDRLQQERDQLQRERNDLFNMNRFDQILNPNLQLQRDRIRRDRIIIGPAIGPVPAIVINQRNVMQRQPIIAQNVLRPINLMNPNNNLQNNNELNNRVPDNPIRILREPVVQNRANLLLRPQIIRIQNNQQNNFNDQLNLLPNNQQQNNQQQNNRNHNNRRMRSRTDIYFDIIDGQNKKINYNFLLKLTHLKTISLPDSLENELLGNILNMRNLNRIKLCNNNIEFRIFKNKLIDLIYYKTFWNKLNKHNCIKLISQLNSSNNRLIRNPIFTARRRNQQRPEQQNANAAANNQPEQQNANAAANNQPEQQNANAAANNQPEQQNAENNQANQWNALNLLNGNNPLLNDQPRNNPDQLDINLEILIGNELNQLEYNLGLNDLFHFDF